MKKIAVAAGDGIGPEIMDSALRVLAVLAERFKFEYELKNVLVGGAAFEHYDSHLPVESLNIIKSCDALLFGSVGGPISDSQLPKWKNCERNSILALRKAFHFNINLRPVAIWPEIAHASPLSSKTIADGVNLVIVRELLGDVYFGEHEQGESDGKRWARDTAEYNEEQIKSITRAAFKIAGDRKKEVCLVHKANVLEISRLWQEIVREVAEEFSDIELKELLVDNCAMQLVSKPGNFDVLLTSNLFGDILSDLAAALPGSLGVVPSASLNDDDFGMFEPAGGSAPEIAGQDIANPIAQILSMGLLVKHVWSLPEAFQTLLDSIKRTLASNICTQDLVQTGTTPTSTTEFTDRLCEEVAGL